MSRSVERAVGVLRQWAEDDYPSGVVDMTVFDLIDTQWGFGIHDQGALTLVWADITDRPADNWSVQISSGLAIDVPDLVGPVQWANAANRQVVIGKYFCALAYEQKMSAAVYETSLPTLYFDLLFDGPHGPGTFQRLGGWLRALQRNNVVSAAEGAREIIGSYGGRRFGPTEADLIALFTVASA
ncbi:hypothetical protein ABZW47_30450 [Streptomyces sp. NPDC004549]|uniref:hypothetical protein n=1 Tax=Streptomyces sp. NPDC004549 TaxID=3154283 RepID=UPI00339FCE06